MDGPTDDGETDVRQTDRQTEGGQADGWKAHLTGTGVGLRRLVVFRGTLTVWCFFLAVVVFLGVIAHDFFLHFTGMCPFRIVILAVLPARGQRFVLPFDCALLVAGPVFANAFRRVLALSG
jgi:hypothetical protein